MDEKGIQSYPRWGHGGEELDHHASSLDASAGSDPHRPPAARDEAFASYLTIPLNRTGIDETVFFPDLLNLLIWRGDNLADIKAPGYFERLDKSQADICAEHLRREVASLLEDVLEDRVQEALDLWVQVVAEQERFDEFEEVARQVGSWNSYRIVRLVDRAMKRRKRSMACKVFEAALTDHGWGQDDLKEKYEQLKRGEWKPNPG